MSTKPVVAALDKLERAHRQALRSSFAYHRSGAGTATAQKHYERYERSAEAFDRQMAQLRAMLKC